MMDPYFLREKTICDQCINWDLLCGSHLMKFGCPRNYLEELIPANNLLNPQQLLFGLLKRVMRSAQIKFKYRSWNEENVTAYCSSNGIRVAGSEVIIGGLRKIIAL